jgi:hypothetical protein
MSPAHQSTPLPPELGIPESDWQQTPMTVRDEFLSLLKRVDALESRLHRDSSNSSRPPSRDSAAKKRERRVKPTERRQPGAKPGHPGINRPCWSRRRPSLCFPSAVAVDTPR